MEKERAGGKKCDIAYWSRQAMDKDCGAFISILLPWDLICFNCFNLSIILIYLLCVSSHVFDLRGHRGHDGPVLAVQFDEQRIVSGGLDGVIKVTTLFPPSTSPSTSPFSLSLLTLFVILWTYIHTYTFIYVHVYADIMCCQYFFWKTHMHASVFISLTTTVDAYLW